MPLFFIKDMNQSNTNLHCINQKPVPTQHQPNTNAHNVSLFPYGFHSPRIFTPTSILPTLSFCAEPKGEVAESIIQKITLALWETGTVADGGWGPVKYIFPHLLINFPQSLDAGVWANFCTLKIDPHRRVETITNFVGSFFTKMSHENNIHQSII